VNHKKTDFVLTAPTNGEHMNTMWMYGTPDSGTQISPHGPMWFAASPKRLDPLGGRWFHLDVGGTVSIQINTVETGWNAKFYLDQWRAGNVVEAVYETDTLASAALGIMTVTDPSGDGSTGGRSMYRLRHSVVTPPSDADPYDSSDEPKRKLGVVDGQYVDIGVGSITVTCDGSIWGFQSIPDWNLNVNSIETIVIPSATMDYKNYANDMFKQGQMVSIELPANTEWDQYIGDYEKVASFAGNKENSFDKNKYTILKVGQMEELGLRTNCIVKNGILMDVGWPMIGDCQSILSYLNLSMNNTPITGSQNAEVWDMYGLNYQTSDVWRETKVSTMHPVQCMNALVQMRRIPFSMPNDGHVTRIIKEVESAAESVMGVASLFA